MRRVHLARSRLLRDESGGVAVVGALALTALIGASAFAVDMGHYRLVRSRMQAAVDSAALAGVRSLKDPALATSEAVDFAARNVPEDFGTITTAADVEIGVFDAVAGTFTVTASASDANAVRVSAERSAGRGNAAPRILSVVLGAKAVTIRTEAVAARQLTLQYNQPESGT